MKTVSTPLEMNGSAVVNRSRGTTCVRPTTAMSIQVRRPRGRRIRRRSQRAAKARQGTGSRHGTRGGGGGGGGGKAHGGRGLSPGGVIKKERGGGLPCRPGAPPPPPLAADFDH